jgi:predicted helicase
LITAHHAARRYVRPYQRITPLQKILAQYRATSQTEREKGSYFEELIRTYFRYEASYADVYSDVWLFADWPKEIGTPEFGITAKDTGIDLVAKTRGTDEYHTIQCKCYDELNGVVERESMCRIDQAIHDTTRRLFQCLAARLTAKNTFTAMTLLQSWSKMA